MRIRTALFWSALLLLSSPAPARAGVSHAEVYLIWMDEAGKALQCHEDLARAIEAEKAADEIRLLSGSALIIENLFGRPSGEMMATWDELPEETYAEKLSMLGWGKYATIILASCDPKRREIRALVFIEDDGATSLVTRLRFTDMPIDGPLIKLVAHILMSRITSSI